MKYFELFESYNPNSIYLHGGPSELQGGHFIRHGNKGHDMGGLFFIEDSITGWKYALGYAILKFRDGGIYRVRINIPKNEVFDFTDKNHHKIARNQLSPEQYNSWVSSSRNGHLDWTQVDDDLFVDWGFRGAMFMEREKGFNQYAQDAVSIAVWDPTDVTIIDFIPKKEALERIRQPKKLSEEYDEWVTTSDRKWHDDRLSKDPYAGPHGGKEFNMVIYGSKPAGFVHPVNNHAKEQIYKFMTYHPEFPLREFISRGDWPTIAIAKPGNMWRLDQIQQLLTKPFPENMKLYHAKLGLLLGYSKKDILKWINNFESW